MRSVLRIGIAALGLGLASGCTHITMLRVQELHQVQSHVDSLKTELALLQQQITEEQKKQSELMRSIRADQATRFSELERNLLALIGSNTEAQDRLTKIDEKTQEIKRRWEEQMRQDSSSTANKNAEVDNLFALGQQDFMAGRYDAALGAFQDILNRFPDAPTTEKAAYWTAECYYVKKVYDKAEIAYLSYIKTYKDGSKLCASLYKLGLVYDAMKKKKSQDMVWDKLLSQCPNTEEAQAVKSRRER
jgi:TolA-binding protein